MLPEKSFNGLLISFLSYRWWWDQTFASVFKSFFSLVSADLKENESFWWNSLSSPFSFPVHFLLHHITSIWASRHPSLPALPSSGLIFTSCFHSHSLLYSQLLYSLSHSVLIIQCFPLSAASSLIRELCSALSHIFKNSWPNVFYYFLPFLLFFSARFLEKIACTHFISSFSPFIYPSTHWKLLSPPVFLKVCVLNSPKTWEWPNTVNSVTAFETFCSLVVTLSSYDNSLVISFLGLCSRPSTVYSQEVFRSSCGWVSWYSCSFWNEVQNI